MEWFERAWSLANANPVIAVVLAGVVLLGLFAWGVVSTSRLR